MPSEGSDGIRFGSRYGKWKSANGNVIFKFAVFMKYPVAGARGRHHEIPCYLAAPVGLGSRHFLPYPKPIPACGRTCLSVCTANQGAGRCVALPQPHPRTNRFTRAGTRAGFGKFRPQARTLSHAQSRRRTRRISCRKPSLYRPKADRTHTPCRLSLQRCTRKRQHGRGIGIARWRYPYAATPSRRIDECRLSPPFAA